jgi:hypothetical protein
VGSRARELGARRDRRPHGGPPFGKPDFERSDVEDQWAGAATGVGVHVSRLTSPLRTNDFDVYIAVELAPEILTTTLRNRVKSYPDNDPQKSG